jgi:hypothetical protein
MSRPRSANCKPSQENSFSIQFGRTWHQCKVSFHAKGSLKFATMYRLFVYTWPLGWAWDEEQQEITRKWLHLYCRMVWEWHWSPVITYTHSTKLISIKFTANSAENGQAQKYGQYLPRDPFQLVVFRKSTLVSLNTWDIVSANKLSNYCCWSSPAQLLLVTSVLVNKLSFTCFEMGPTLRR